MLEQAIYKHLLQCSELALYLTEYAEKPAVFFQKAPPDTDLLWQNGAQYGRIVFAIDAEGDPARAVGGRLFVDIFCEVPELPEQIVREKINGYFFTENGCTMAAQWEDSRYFTEQGDPKVNGVTLTFSLLAFPLLTTENPDIIARFNHWTAENFPDLSVIGLGGLPEVWKPAGKSAGIYWRVTSVAPAEWIPDTWQTIWRTAILQGHIFAQDVSAASVLAHEMIFALDRAKHLVRSGETQIIIRRTRVDNSADALHTGQITVDATYAQIKHPPQADTLRHIHFK